MGKGMEIMMTYLVTDGVEDCKTIKLTAKEADAIMCKDDLPVFTNHTPAEKLLVLLEEMKAIMDCYGWLATAEGNQNPKAELAFQHIRRVLKGIYQRKWVTLVAN